MEIRIGERVRVVDGGLPEYQQLGTVVAAGSSVSWYVHLDAAVDPAAQTFFQAEELYVVGSGSRGAGQLRETTA